MAWAFMFIGVAILMGGFRVTLVRWLCFVACLAAMFALYL